MSCNGAGELEDAINDGSRETMVNFNLQLITLLLIVWKGKEGWGGKEGERVCERRDEPRLKKTEQRAGYLKRKKLHGRRWVELEMLCSWCGKVENQLRWKTS